MDPTQILHELATAEDLPVEAIAAARENRAALAPAFVQEVERFVAGERHGDTRALFFLFHLLGEWREKSAYRPLAALLRLPPDDVNDVLGDAITETSHRVVASVFEGDPAPLYAVISDPKADEFVRAAMCKALVIVTLRGELARDEAAAFLRACAGELRPKRECYVWEGWQCAIAMLGLVELVPLVRQAFERGFISDDWSNLADFEEDLERTVTGQPRTGWYCDNEFEPFGDTIEELSWSGYAAGGGEEGEVETEGEPDGDGQVVWRSFEQGPAVNPYRDVGRNDPCPCGSGKKFKKCCLGKVEAREREQAAAARLRAEVDLDAPFADDYDDLGSPVAAYDPLVAPDPDDWLALDDDEKNLLVKDYHRRAGDDLPRPDAHAAVHAVVENQVAEGDALPVRRKLAALMAEGLDRHEAIHAIGSVLMTHINDAVKRSAEAGAAPTSDAYFADLEDLTAESWRRTFA